MGWFLRFIMEGYKPSVWCGGLLMAFAERLLRGWRCWSNFGDHSLYIHYLSCHEFHSGVYRLYISILRLHIGIWGWDFIILVYFENVAVLTIKINCSLSVHT